MKKRAIVLSRRVESRILVLRGHRVILDADLAELYGVEVKRLNQQVKRNIDRFPGDFVLQLSSAEYESLRLQFATSNEGRGGRRYLPYAFTEHGAIMAATVLNSQRAIEMSIFMAPPPPNGRRIGLDYTSSSAKLRGKPHGSLRHSVKPRTISRISCSKTTAASTPSSDGNV